jgi:FkbH-like protein
LGEEGVANIKIGGDYPGSAFLMFQQFLVKLSENGVILTVCSKNNEQDVLDAWAQNPFIVLKKNHIAACRIGWNNKAQSINELAKELNIGLDSMVFIDDNPTERELIRQTLSTVVVPDFPTQPYLLPHFMEELLNNYFRVYSLTNEDLKKTSQYKANAQRAHEQTKFVDFEAYLTSLNMQLTIEPVNEFTVGRIAQMTQKTNQFNLTGKKYSEDEIRNMMRNKCEMYALSVSDKFGDSGVTGVIILEKIDTQTREIDTLLMSCRILGKQIEYAFLITVLNSLKENGVKFVRACYIPTSKNMQVKDFYEKIGFQRVRQGEEKEIWYMGELEKMKMKMNACFNVVRKNGEGF